jgi:hypothetical protein
MLEEQVTRRPSCLERHALTHSTATVWHSVCPPCIQEIVTAEQDLF